VNSDSALQDHIFAYRPADPDDIEQFEKGTVEQPLMELSFNIEALKAGHIPL
jgi:hypothetical protein